MKRSIRISYPRIAFWLLALLVAWLMTPLVERLFFPSSSSAATTDRSKKDSSETTYTITDSSRIPYESKTSPTTSRKSKDILGSRGATDEVAKNHQGTDEFVHVKIEVDGLQPQGGNCNIAIYDSASSFNDISKALQLKSIQLVSDRDASKVSASFQLPKTKSNQIAAAAYQDANGNGMLDKNSLGIPVERFGFSNKAKGSFGPPTFAQAAINIANSQHGDDLSEDLRNTTPSKSIPSQFIVIPIRITGLLE